MEQTTAAGKKRNLVQARVTEKELETIEKKFRQSTCRKLSEYVRKVLLDKPITVKQRNQSLDDLMQELIRLRSELNAIANNYNQVVRRLHGMDSQADVREWLSLHTSAHDLLLHKMTEIKSKIASINDLWLQS